MEPGTRILLALLFGAFIFSLSEAQCNGQDEKMVGTICYKFALPKGPWNQIFNVCRNLGFVGGASFSKAAHTEVQEWVDTLNDKDKYQIALVGITTGQDDINNAKNVVLTLDRKRSNTVTISAFNVTSGDEIWTHADWKPVVEEPTERRVKESDGEIKYDGHDYPYLCMQRSCPSDPCKNGGVCFETDNEGPVCSCPDGWQGPTCEIVDNCYAENEYFIDGICYKFLSPDTLWPDMFAVCQSLGMVAGATFSKSSYLTLDYWISTMTGSHYQIALTTAEGQVVLALDPYTCNVLNITAFNVSSGDEIWTYDKWQAGETEYQCKIADKCENDAGKDLPHTCMKRECSNDPCTNGGVCFQTLNQGPVCSCPKGFTGPHCDSKQCTGSANCPAHAYCSDQGCDVRICVCYPGYTGANCTEINECASTPCLNGGSCVDQVNNFSCTCDQTHYGDLCENYCDTVWTSWSDCSASCDYGTRFRAQKQINYAGAVASCPSEPDNYEHQPCNTQYCSSFAMPYSTQFTTCTSLNGFFTKNRCYFLVDSAKWIDIAPACEAATSGGQPGLLYDTNELQNHVWAFLLENSPEIPIWWSIKYTQIDAASFKMEWMIGQSTGYLPVRFPAADNLNLSPGQEKCLWIQLSEITSDIRPTKVDWADCVSIPPFMAPKALCQTSEKFYADFRTQKNTRITIADSSLTFPASVEKEAWFCGLRCRRTDRCIGFNFQKSTGTCEPLTVDEELLVDGKVNWGGIDIRIYNKDTLAIGWNHYPRIY